ncbi:MAG: HD domain-containing protein [Alphaproteobacteria bacterium]|nr:HD domain-containing protein [Alphaproteobacteria bacterium]
MSQVEHALQAATAAEWAGASPALITEALFHDIGHFFHDFPEDCAERGIDSRHEDASAAILARHFGPAIVEPVRLHVAAKRYLAATEPGYHDWLSPASILSLKLQGGPFDPASSAAFRATAFAEGAVRLRRWDEAAKAPGTWNPQPRSLPPLRRPSPGITQGPVPRWTSRVRSRFMTSATSRAWRNWQTRQT